jgi:hypothetical protein
MALARVVAFENVTQEQIDRLRREIEEGDRPEDVPASEIMLLHDPDADKALAVLFFENEDDYRRGDAALDAMPADETPGRRVSVTKYNVATRMVQTPAAH